MSKPLSVSLAQSASRRVHGVKTVSAGAVNRPIPQPEFRDACVRHQKEAAAQAHEVPRVVEGLWKLEGLSTTFGKYRLPDNTLNDPGIPIQAQPICHVGYGAATTEFTHFNATQLHAIFADKCAPGYSHFSYEGIGSALRIYEPGFFKFMCGVLGLIPRHAPPGPDGTGFYAAFFGAFPPEMRFLIMHGYGRLVGFSNISVYKALAEAAKLPDPHAEPCAQGIGFAFAMMSSADLPRVLENSEVPGDPRIRAAFQNGLVYALVFDEWFAPGCLEAWQPRGLQEEKLVTLARAEAALNFRRGTPLVFRLDNPLRA